MKWTSGGKSTVGRGRECAGAGFAGRLRSRTANPRSGSSPGLFHPALLRCPIPNAGGHRRHLPKATGLDQPPVQSRVGKRGGRGLGGSIAGRDQDPATGNRPRARRGGIRHRHPGQPRAHGFLAPAQPVARRASRHPRRLAGGLAAPAISFVP